MKRLKACRAEALAPGRAIRIDHAPPIAVIRGESGAIFAVDDTCTHANASLSEGYVEGDTVECPLHMAVFSLRTGKPQTPPANTPLRTYTVNIVDGDVFVETDE